MTNYILAIDQGTTSSRAILFSTQGKVKYQAQQEFAQHFPRNGWVEHKPEDLWQTVTDSAREVIGQLDLNHDTIKAIGIANQRETTLVWHKETGQAIYPAIVWQDRRTSEYCQELKDKGMEAGIQQKTGLLIDPYFSATKLRWILDNVDHARPLAEQGKLLFGTVDSYLIWRLTQGASHRTDATNASRTLLFNIHTQDWDDELLELFAIPRCMLPQVMDSADDFGMADKECLGVEIPILGVAGDQHAALFGQTCFHEGMAKSTYGTGCFMMLNTGDKALISQHRLLTTLAYRLKGKATYALEGSIFMAGATVQWLRDGLKLIEHASEAQTLAEQTPLDHGVYLVPAFTGLGAPYWDPDARGAIMGMTRDTGIKELVSAGLQSVCYQTRDLQSAMEQDGEKPTALRVDGGMVVNDWLMQFLADILAATVDRPEVIETTALGVTYLAGLQAGVYDSLETLESMWQQERRFAPKIPQAERDKLYEKWLHAVRCVQAD